MSNDTNTPYPTPSPSAMSGQDIKSWRDLIAQLERAGYFSYTRPEDLTYAKGKILEDRSLWPLDAQEDIGRIVIGDGKRLAEGGVLGLLFQVSPYLQREGVNGFMIYLDQDIQPGRFAYWINVNGARYDMLRDDESGEVAAWATVTVRAFRLVNTLLEQAGSTERLYIVEDTLGAESLGVFLTPEQYRIISQSPLIPEGQGLVSTDDALKIYGR